MPDPLHRKPVRTIADLETLNSAEVQEGYHDGSQNLSCGDNRSRDYWHGWKNGRRDYGHDRTYDPDAAALVREVIESGWLKRLGVGEKSR